MSCHVFYVFYVAIAASAPIWGFPLDECETDGSAKTVTFAASPGGGSAHLCADNLKSAYVLIDNLGKTQEGRDLLSSTMGLCSPLSSERDVSTLLTYLQSPLFNLAEGSYPFETDYITFALTYSTIPLPAWPMRVMCEDLKYDYGVEIFGTPEDVKFTVSSTTPKVEFYADWEITSNSYRSDENLIDAFANVPIDHNNSMGLLHDVAAAIQIWYNLTGVETCVNWDDGAAPSSNSQSSFVSLEISTNMVDSNVCTMNAAEFDAGLGWNTLTCNEGLNLINWWVQGVGNDLYYPPNQKKDYEYADLVSHSLDYCAAFKSQGLYGIPDKGHYDTWSLWDDTTYGGLRLSQSSNIVFTNGNLDPWIAAGVTLNTSSIKSLVIDQGAHHLDLFFPTEQDPESVK